MNSFVQVVIAKNKFKSLAKAQRGTESSLDDEKEYMFGEKGSWTTNNGTLQDFNKLRDAHHSEGIFFEDAQFICQPEMLGVGNIQWKRPHELILNPKLCIDGKTSLLMENNEEQRNYQLKLAMSYLKKYNHLFSKVVPEDQSFDGDNYAGIFHFRFWQYGRWVDIVIDDRLPTKDGKLLFFVPNKISNELWSCLLAKAYAKLLGSYKALIDSTLREALRDFTQSLCERINLKKEGVPANIFQIMMSARARQSVIICKNKAKELHIIKEIRVVNGRIEILFYASDGELAMLDQDFIDKFDEIELNHWNYLYNPSIPLDLSVWRISSFEGSWKKGITAGGCSKLPTFINNPQYRITLEEKRLKTCKGKFTVIIALMQKLSTSSKIKDCLNSLSIGINIYKIDQSTALKPLNKEFFQTNVEIVKVCHEKVSELTCRIELEPGTYCIVPSTFDSAEEGEFLLRVFTECLHHMEENDTTAKELLNSNPNEVKVNLGDAVIKLYNEQEIETEFRKLAGDLSEINWLQLQTLLNSSLQKVESYAGFDKDICRSMLAMYDDDFSGTMGINECKHLWSDIVQWTQVFHQFDYDKSNSICASELRQAFKATGFSVNNHIIKLLILRYGTDGCLHFDDFITSIVELKKLIDIFKLKSNEEMKAQFTIDEWLIATIYS